MTDDRLKQIEEGESKATPGPWVWFPYGEPFQLVHSEDGKTPQYSSRDSIMGVNINERLSFNRSEDKEFIARARQDVPYLITALHAAQAERDHWYSEAMFWSEGKAKAEDQGQAPTT